MPLRSVRAPGAPEPGFGSTGSATAGPTVRSGSVGSNAGAAAARGRGGAEDQYGVCWVGPRSRAAGPGRPGIGEAIEVDTEPGTKPGIGPAIGPGTDVANGVGSVGGDVDASDIADAASVRLRRRRRLIRTISPTSTISRPAATASWVGETVRWSMTAHGTRRAPAYFGLAPGQRGPLPKDGRPSGSSPRPGGAPFSRLITPLRACCSAGPRPDASRVPCGAPPETPAPSGAGGLALGRGDGVGLGFGLGAFCAPD